jgi:hypothetical protein
VGEVVVPLLLLFCVLLYVPKTVALCVCVCVCVPLVVFWVVLCGTPDRHNTQTSATADRRGNSTTIIPYPFLPLLLDTPST